MPIKKSVIPLIVPLITCGLIFYLIKINYPGSITGIDPEYVCLLNGLNISILQFDNIGFTDSPGTPFLVVSGILIRIVHLFLGNGAIVEDVLSRPDFYMQMSSFLLLFVTFFILIRGGRKIYNATENIFATVLLQGAFLLSPINTMLQHRFNMDRLLPIIAFLLTVYTVLYLYNKISVKKYSVFAGLLMGVGLITKFNFIVLAIIPLLIIPGFRNLIIYGGSFILSSVVSFLPIIDKYKNFTKFINKLIFHEGTYGSGEKGMFNLDLIFDSFQKMTLLNQSFIIICGLALVSIIVSNRKEKQLKNHSKYILIIAGIVVATLAEVLLASKIYKNSYMAPVVAMSGILFFCAYSLFSARFNLKNNLIQKVTVPLFVLLSIPTFIEAKEAVEITKTRVNNRQPMSAFIENNILPNHYLLIEPTWKAGPTHLNGIIYGLSYVAARNEFTDTYLKLYPKVLTYENDNRPFKHCRTKDASIDKIFTNDNSVFLISTPVRNTRKVMKELAMQASYVSMQTHFDTVFTSINQNDHIIRARFSSDEIPGSEKSISFFNNMEEDKQNWNHNAISNEKAFSGAQSSKIKRGDKYSSVCEIDSIQNFASEINKISVSCKYFQENYKNSARLVIEIFNPKDERFWYPVSCIDYCKQEKNWDTFSYEIYVPMKFREAQKANIYFYNSSKNDFFIDDFQVQLTTKD